MALRGSLDPATLAREVESGAIETVITALPDLYGRLVGKRIQAGFYCDEIAAPRHARLRVPAGLRHGDGPDAGLRLHELGQGLRRPARGARPGEPAPRRLAGSQRDRDLRCARGRTRRADRGGAALDPEAPARALRRARPAARDGKRARVLPVPRRLPHGARQGLPGARARRAATWRTTTCSRAPSPSRSWARSGGASTPRPSRSSSARASGAPASTS